MKYHQTNFPFACIKDAKKESFKEFPRFVYTDDCKITAKNAVRVLYLAKKYLISSLTEMLRDSRNKH